MKKYFVLVALLLVSFIVFTGCATQEGNVNTGEVPTINVTGVGKITTEPDMVEIRVNVGTEGKDKDVQEKNAEKTQNVIDALLSLGLDKDEMETQNIRFFPQRRWSEKNGNQIIGYQAENTIIIKTKKIEKAAQIVDIAVENGAQRVDDLQFSLSDEGKAKLLDKGIGEAVSDARKQAEAVAKAAGVEIIGIKNIDVQKSFESRPIYYSADSMLKNEAKSVNTPVLPKDAEYSMIVNVAFKIK